MNKKTLTSLFADALYQIPDYQRGYAWEEKAAERSNALERIVRFEVDALP